jgi:protease-4
MKFFKNFLACLLAILVAQFIVLFIFIGVISASVASTEKSVEVKNNSVLEIDFSVPIQDKVDQMSKIIGLIDESAQSLKLRKVIESIQYAKNDNKIKGISLKLSSFNTSISNADEIKKALIEFKTSGKFVTAFADNFDQRSYYMASNADSVYMHPIGYFFFNGLGGSRMFYARGLEKLGVKAHVIRSGKFKSAIEPFIRTNMSKESKLQTEEFLNSIWSNVLAGISNNRKISVDKLNEIADQMLVQNSDDAIKYNFIDSKAYFDQYQDAVKNMAKSEKYHAVKVGDYIANMNLDNMVNNQHKDKIAVLYAQGEITMGGKEQDKITPAFANQIKKAREDENVKAVVLRVNSPGGSAHASDIIWREIELTKKVKPVIASFGSVAASGGYYISCGANKIVAEENTITGSIGVFGLLFSGEKLLSGKLGLDFDTYKTNKHSDFLGGAMLPVMSRPINEFERKVYGRMIDQIYDRFTGIVAQGRGKSVKEIHEIAQGRVWVGVKAKEIGLVDELGGLDVAVKIAAKEANVSNYELVEMIDKDDFFAQLTSMYTMVKTSLGNLILGDEGVAFRKIKSELKNSGALMRMPVDYVY